MNGAVSSYKIITQSIRYKVQIHLRISYICPIWVKLDMVYVGSRKYKRIF